MFQRHPVREQATVSFVEGNTNVQVEVLSREPAAAVQPAHATPILCVHGAWHAAWCWDEYFLPYFATCGYPAHALSLRGHGLSDGRSFLRWTSIEDYVADLHCVITRLPRQLPRPPVLIGHSMGCWVVQKYMERYPATAAVLLAPVPPGGPWAFLFDMLRRYPLQTFRANPFGPMRIPSVEVAHWFMFSHDMPHSQVAAYYERLEYESTYASLQTLFGRLHPRKDLSIPLLVLGALDDRLFSLPELIATARLQQAQVEVFPHMSHDMMLERQWQRVANRIIGWLQAHDI